MSGENWIEYPDDPDRACLFGRPPNNLSEMTTHLEIAKRVIVAADADLERARQAWVDGDDPMCDDVCLIECKGPCCVNGAEP